MELKKAIRLVRAHNGGGAEAAYISGGGFAPAGSSGESRLKHTGPGVIAVGRRAVHGILKHPAWQPRKAARGHCGRKPDHFGEPSDFFYSTVRQFKEREGNRP